VARKLGFELHRRKGSHAVFKREKDGKRVVIPVHKGKIIKPKTLLGIIADLGVDKEEFASLL
jgi:predicted RNA binding protein YcfA (HicA-like mRNA interferase family)